MHQVPCPSYPGQQRASIRWYAFVRLLVAAAAIIGAGVLGSSQLAARLTLNVTASMPRGLYWLAPSQPIRRGSVVYLPVPAPVRALVADRQYLPANFGLLKRVVALGGDHVCTEGHRYVVGDRLISPIADRDHLGRPLTPYAFCSTVPPGAAFLAAAGDSSLDSRYFGPVSLDGLTPAVPLWTSY